MVVDDLTQPCSENYVDEYSETSVDVRKAHQAFVKDFVKDFMTDIDKIFADLSDNGFVTLPNYATDAASGWFKLRQSELKKDVIFYHTYTVERVRVDASPHFYFHFRGDAQKIVNSCTRVGFQINHVGNDLIGITRKSTA